MSEYIVCVDDLEESYYRCTDIKPETVFGHRIREEIVRCRDCAYICNRECANGLEYHTCSYFDSEYAEVEPNGFCSWGERREP